MLSMARQSALGKHLVDDPRADSQVDFVTLSDSVPSLPRCPAVKPTQEAVAKGVPKVVCLDSDTDSDGSYKPSGVKGLPGRIAKDLTLSTIVEKTEKRRILDLVAVDSAVERSNDAHKKPNINWSALHSCSSRSPSTSRCSEERNKPLLGYKALEEDKNSHSVGMLELEAVSSVVELSNDALKKPNWNDLHICPRKKESWSPSTSRCSEESSKPPLGYKALDEDKSHGSVVGISSHPLAGTSLVSIESDDYLWNSPMPAWNDPLDDLIKRSQPSTSDDAELGYGNRQAIEHKRAVECIDQERDSGEFSFSRRSLPDTGQYGCPSELSDSGDSIGCKKRKHNDGGGGGYRKTGGGGSDPSKKALKKAEVLSAKEAENQRKMEERTKKRQEEEARKKQKQQEKAQLKREKEEEKKRQQEERKKRNEEEKRRKEELKAEALERRKVEREKEKWGKGKFALQNITVLVDTEVVEGGLIGGYLLGRLAEKGFKYHLVTNPVRKTVVWQIKLPSKDLPAGSQSQESQGLEASGNRIGSQLLLENVDISYILVVLEAEEFSDMIAQGSLDKHILNIQRQYPGFTLCYLINKLMWYLHKREQQQYKNPGDSWRRPPVEQALAQLVTSYDGVHSRLCLDEAEVADHIVGLTRSLAECPFKRKLTTLSLSANGDHVVKHDPNKEVIKKNMWLKALVAIPKISGSCAIAIATKYPSMSALYKAYLDPSRTVHEKEFLLQDLIKEGLFGGEGGRRVGPVCSRRVYRILMAQQGNLKTDDVEEGADLFKS